MTTAAPNQVNFDVLIELIQNRPDIPEGKSGDVEITHEIIQPGEETTVVSLRNAIFMGQQPTKATFAEPLTIRKLVYEGGTWMTDHPQELWQMREPIYTCHGSVLVGGLGLGVLSHLLSRICEDVDSVTTVEKDPDIIRLVQYHIDADRVVQTDLFNYLKGLECSFYDSAVFDIWQGTGETTWQNYVVPLRRLWIKSNHKNHTCLCWNEMEMQGQCVNSLTQLVDVDTNLLPLHGTFYQRVFREAMIKKKIRPRKAVISKSDQFAELINVELHNREDEELQKWIQIFLSRIGEPIWEKTFGKLWDQYKSLAEKDGE